MNSPEPVRTLEMRIDADNPAHSLMMKAIDRVYLNGELTAHVIRLDTEEGWVDVLAFAARKPNDDEIPIERHYGRVEFTFRAGNTKH